jgi:GAF domain-containing protein
MAPDEQMEDPGLQTILNAGLSGRPPELLLEGRIEQVIAAATEVLGVEGVGLVLQDESKTLRVVGAAGPGTVALEDAQIELHLGPCLDSFAASTTISVADLADSPAYRSLWDRVSGSGTRAVLSAPIRVRSVAVGNLDATLRRPHEWSLEEVRAIEAYAGIVGFTLGLAAQATYLGDLSGRLRSRLELAAGGNDRLD